MALFLSEADVKQLLTMETALAAVEEAHTLLANLKATNMPRQRVKQPPYVLHLMGAAIPSKDLIGYKAYLSGPTGIVFEVHLYSLKTGEKLATIQADHLGRMRTGAASGVAAKYLAPQEAKRVALFGCGRQAFAQIEAISKVRAIEEVRVFCRTQESRERFAAEIADKPGIKASATESPKEAVEGADIVVTITNSSKPVFDGDDLKGDCLVIAAGSNMLNRREIDGKTLKKTVWFVVDSVEQALLEAGDLLPALDGGRLKREEILELGTIIWSARAGGDMNGGVVLYESLGLAIQDIAVAAEVLSLAQQQKIGQEINL